MNDAAYQRLWSWTALVQLTFMVALFVRTTSGGKPAELFGGLVVNAATVPALGLPLDLALGIAILALTLRWSSEHKADPWTVRVPTFKLAPSEIDVEKKLGKLYKALTFLAANVVPLAATAQMTVRYFESKIYLWSGELVIPGGWSQFDYATVASAAARTMLRFGDPKLGLEHFAILPWAYALLAFVYVALFVSVVWSVFKRPKSGGGTEPLVLRNVDVSTGG